MNQMESHPSSSTRLTLTLSLFFLSSSFVTAAIAARLAQQYNPKPSVAETKPDVPGAGGRDFE